MKRAGLDYLKKWKDKKTRKPLIIRGARQVGKSYLVRLFAKEHALDLLEINFELNNDYIPCFKSENPKQIITLLELKSSQKVAPGKTLLFLDEIQAAPEVLASLRYFYEILPQLHVIAAGSLLEFVLEEHSFSMPVGRIEYMYLIETWGTSIGILVDNGLRLFYRDFMPRKSRIDAPGALHHIIVRGIERRKIFYDDSDRDNFLKRLGVVLSDTKTPCFAWALIPNHLHLLLRTGVAPIATVMRRLLTGYAVNFNHRHRRHGQLFQNRYKSILCQEDQYLLELVRYIHLNPLRAGLISDLKELDKHPYCGHSVLMGKKKHDWQDTNYILKFYDSKYAIARRRYRDYVKKGIPEGRRPDLVGGGLIRSAGGWSIVKALRKSAARMKGDERILGDGNFVEKVLRESKENFERKHRFESKGYDFDWLVKQVADLLDIEPRDVLAHGKYKQTVKARGLLCYWGTRELGMTTVELAKKLNLAQPTISQSAMRGQKVAAEEGLKLLKQIK